MPGKRTSLTKPPRSISRDTNIRIWASSVSGEVSVKALVYQTVIKRDLDNFSVRLWQASLAQSWVRRCMVSATVEFLTTERFEIEYCWKAVKEATGNRMRWSSAADGPRTQQVYRCAEHVLALDISQCDSLPSRVALVDKHWCRQQIRGWISLKSLWTCVVSRQPGRTCSQPWCVRCSRRLLTQPSQSLISRLGARLLPTHSLSQLISELGRTGRARSKLRCTHLVGVQKHFGNITGTPEELARTISQRLPIASPPVFSSRSTTRLSV